MICPNCLSEIQDDSSYCDQCGAKIMICPTCGKIGKSDFCLDDGSKLVHNSVDKNFTQRSFFKTERTAASNPIKDKEILKLINKNLAIEISIDSETIIGRTFGKFTEVFSNYNQISSKHILLKPTDDNTGWYSVDLNSSNGSKLNGEKLIPGKEYSIKKGDFLTLANIEFYVA